MARLECARARSGAGACAAIAPTAKPRHVSRQCVRDDGFGRHHRDALFVVAATMGDGIGVAARASIDVAAHGYWMTLVVADALKGWAGGTPVVSCQSAPLSSVAKARLPVEPILNGAAVAI